MGEFTAAIFRDGKVVEHVALDAGLLPGAAHFVWIEVLGPAGSDLSALQERFGLHRLAVEDAMSAEQIPKVDLYDDQIFVVMRAAYLEGDAIRYGEIDAFVNSHHIITVRHEPGDGHVHALERFQAGSRTSDVKPDLILHGILSYVVNGYFPIVQMVEDEVLSLEPHLQDALLERNEITRLFQLRREAIHFRHVLTRMADVCGKLSNLEVPCISAEAKPYFRDVQDHLIRLDGMVKGLLDVIRTVFEASSLLEQQRQGVNTRQLAAWAAILGVPAAVAGVYGMTSPYVPQLHTLAGYGVAVALMLSVCLGLFIRFKRLRWV
jgi:magnesium transporter